MRKILAVLLIAISSLAQAAVMQAKDQAGTTVTIRSEACNTPAVLAPLAALNAQLEAGGLPKVQSMQAADVLYQGKSYSACWAQVGPLILVIDDGGVDTSVFTVPARDFVAVQEI